VSHAGPRTARYLPAWFWILGSIVVGVALLFGVGSVVAAVIPKPGTQTSAENTISTSTEPPSPSATPSATASAAPTAAPVSAPVSASTQSQGASVGGASTLGSSDVAAIQTAVDAHDTATLQGYLGATVGVVIPSQGQNGSQSAATAISELSQLFTTTDPWTFSIDPTTLTHYRQGSFGAYFPSKAIMARSSDGHVISLIPSGGTIVTMLLASDDTLLLAN
jgi:hypothetical protein